jgi:hypothetical protein
VSVSQPSRAWSSLAELPTVARSRGQERRLVVGSFESCVQPGDRPHHRMSEPVRSRGELYRHERIVHPPAEIQFSVGLFFQAGSFRPQCGSSFLTTSAPQIPGMKSLIASHWCATSPAAARLRTTPSDARRPACCETAGSRRELQHVDVLIVALVADESRFGCVESPGSNRGRSRTLAG